MAQTVLVAEVYRVVAACRAGAKGVRRAVAAKRRDRTLNRPGQARHRLALGVPVAAACLEALAQL